MGEHAGSPLPKPIETTAHLIIWKNVGATLAVAQMKTQHNNTVGNRKGCPYPKTLTKTHYVRARA
jgi:hypothetical protein